MNIHALTDYRVDFLKKKKPKIVSMSCDKRKPNVFCAHTIDDIKKKKKKYFNYVVNIRWRLLERRKIIFTV